jgi:ATP-dependent protease ClpP protease subunit
MRTILNEDDDLESLMPLFSKGRVKSSTQTVTNHLIFLDDDITEPSNYRDVTECLLSCSPNDNVDILINSHGGHIDTALQIIQAMNACAAAHVGVTVIGAAYSAASMIACAAREVMIADNAEFMLHTAQYGSVGTVPNVRSQTDFVTRQITRLLDQSYSGFLTEKEMAELKSGREFWFDAEEARKRMANRHRKLEADYKAAAQAQVEAAMPKKVAPTKKTPIKRTRK